MSKNYSDSDLLSFIKDITTEKELFIKLGYTAHPNKIVCDKWFSKYESLGINIKSILRNNKKKLNQKSYICKQCGKVFTEKYSKHSSGDFCCRKCAKQYANKFVDRDKLSKTMKELVRIGKVKLPQYKKSKTLQYKKSKTLIEIQNEYNDNPKICPICGKTIPYEKRKKKTCSMECGRKLATLNNPYKNCGGYREGSSKGKHGYYKGIWCDSTYELAYLIYCLDHNIDIKRCTEAFEYELNGKKHTYHPDFVVEGIITEIKNYYRQENDIKLNSINKEKRIYYYEDLIYCFDYVAKTYNKKYRKRWNNFYELYDKT